MYSKKFSSRGVAAVGIGKWELALDKYVFKSILLSI
jgi:hypothetical protein